MEKMYCIFQVYNYKGGELSSHINLDHKRFISRLSEYFDGVNFDDIVEKRDKKIKVVLDDVNKLSDISEIKRKLKEFIEEKDFSCIYAGADCIFCGEIYEVENNKLKQVHFESYLDDIAEFLIEREYLR